MTPLEVLVLHSVFHRTCAKRLADLCLVLGIEDTHTVVYALKKLEARGLVKSRREGKEKVITISDKGRAACERYRDVRNSILVDVVGELALPQAGVSQVAALMRTMSGYYAQATRTAATL
jgi:predicted MarR family transcription regulator